MGDNDLLVPASALANDKAWAIVRRLAESDPYQQRPTTIGWWAVCVYCKLPSGHYNHADDCLWQNAREVLDAKA